jgi:hypothetical protein
MGEGRRAETLISETARFCVGSIDADANCVQKNDRAETKFATY